jgi:hypothetical protein
VLWLMVWLAGCRDPAEHKPTPSASASGATAPSTTAAPAPPYPEASWDEVARLIESGKVTWIVPAASRRLFVTTRSGAEHVTSAPDDTALATLVDRVDPKRERLVVTRQYQEHREIRWSEIPSMLARSKVLWVQQNGRRRVIIDVLNEDGSAGRGYITLQPRHGAIEPLVPKRYPNGMFVKSFDFQEITWPEAKKIMRENAVSISLAHVGRVIIHVKGSKARPYLSIEPKTNDAVHWIKANKPGSLLSVE